MGDELIGRSIRVETEEGTFDGVIHGVDSKNKKLILNKGGYQLFYILFCVDSSLIDSTV